MNKSFNELKSEILSKEFLTTQEAAFYISKIKGLPGAATSLRTYISRQGGPKYYKYKRSVRYTIPLIDEWIKQRMSAPKSFSMEGINND